MCLFHTDLHRPEDYSDGDAEIWHSPWITLYILGPDIGFEMLSCALVEFNECHSQHAYLPLGKGHVPTSYYLM